MPERSNSSRKSRKQSKEENELRSNQTDASSSSGKGPVNAWLGDQLGTKKQEIAVSEAEAVHVKKNRRPRPTFNDADAVSRGLEKEKEQQSATSKTSTLTDNVNEKGEIILSDTLKLAEDEDLASQIAAPPPPSSASVTLKLRRQAIEWIMDTLENKNTQKKNVEDLDLSVLYSALYPVERVQDEDVSWAPWSRLMTRVKSTQDTETRASNQSMESQRLKI